MATTMMSYSTAAAPSSFLRKNCWKAATTQAVEFAPQKQEKLRTSLRSIGPGLGDQGMAFSTVVKAASTLAPRATTVTTITAAMAATMMPYSTAVAPSSFLKNRL